VANVKRIGMVIGQLTVGGAEGQLLELIRGLDRDRFDPVVYSLSEQAGGMQPRFEAAGVRVERIGAIGWTRARRLAAACRRDRIDVVHSWLFIANSYAWVARRLGVRAPLVTSARNCKSQGIGHHALNVAAFRGSARVIANSQQVRTYIVDAYRAPARRIDVIYNGVDTTRFSTAPPHQADAPIVVAAGRLVAQKNFALLVDAAARLHAEVPGARFRIAGTGPQHEALRERIRTAGLQDVIELLGERSDIDAVFRAADVFWLTSSWEGLPNVVIEAMASGLPVVATDVGGARELFVSGREGFLVRPDSVEDFVYYGGVLLRDAPLRRTMAVAARARAEQFTVRRMIANTQDVYDAVLAEAA
jgi:glycosyltransferase involved in cell wall biosynthesis